MLRLARFSIFRQTCSIKFSEGEYRHHSIIGQAVRILAYIWGLLCKHILVGGADKAELQLSINNRFQDDGTQYTVIQAPEICPDYWFSVGKFVVWQNTVL
jgi:hypothetical protein